MEQRGAETKPMQSEMSNVASIPNLPVLSLAGLTECCSQSLGVLVGTMMSH